jgi:hypothetical protein
MATTAGHSMADVTRLLENPVEATTIVQHFVLLLVENVVVAVTVFLHITDVAEVVFMQIQIHCIFKSVGGTSYQPSCDVTSFCFL